MLLQDQSNRWNSWKLFEGRENHRVLHEAASLSGIRENHRIVILSMQLLRCYKACSLRVWPEGSWCEPALRLGKPASVLIRYEKDSKLERQMHAVLLANTSSYTKRASLELPAIDGVRQCEPPPGVTGFAGMNPDSISDQRFDQLI